ncbi:hypothetical protein EDD22DRAFT_1050900 [Suillus occidentalis]|nr:hypothetical protein EDD22DRAFT_1050900 [Suillus occidentalis]
MPVPGQLMFQTWIASLHTMPVGMQMLHLQTEDCSKTLTTAKFKPHLELVEPCDSLSALLKLMFNLKRDSVEVWAHAARTNSSSLQRRHYHESIFLFNPSFITPTILSISEGQSIQTRTGKSLLSAYPGRDSKPDSWFIDRSMYHSNYPSRSAYRFSSIEFNFWLIWSFSFASPHVATPNHINMQYGHRSLRRHR